MKLIKIGLSIILGLIVFAVLFVAGMTVFEYRPDDIETVEISSNVTTKVSLNEDITLMTFNMGYAGLGEDEDFVMDGGEKGRPDSKTVVETYLEGIKSILKDYPADIVLMQEVDLRARRSYRINQYEEIYDLLGNDYNSQFAYNFKVPFVPFPLSLTDYIGYVESGIASYMTYQVMRAERHQFPGAFSWPLRVANLKRAMMVSYLDIEGSDKQLVVVNLHMSAYDGDGSLRAQEMAYLKSFMSEEYEKGNYVIIGGDFNQTFPEAVDVYPVSGDLYVAYPIEDTFLPDGFEFVVDVTKPTCRLLNQPYDPESDQTQYYIIDGFIVSDNITVSTYGDDQVTADAYTLDLSFEYSDHNPVMMTVRLNG